MKVFITGGTGFVGSHIVRELLEQGHNVTVLTRKPAFTGPNPQAKRVACEWRREALREHLAEIDVVIHNAVIWDNEEDLDDIRASLQLFEAAADAKVRHLIYTSSTAVHRPFSPKMDERQVLRTNDLYGATKAANELFLSAVSESMDLPYTIFRAGSVVGNPIEGLASNADRRLRAMFSTAKEGGVIEVAANEGRQFVGVRSLAKLYAEAVTKPGRRQTYVAVAEPVVFWRELAERVIETVGAGTVAVSPESPMPFVFDTAKLKSDFATKLRADEDIDAMFLSEAATKQSNAATRH